MQEKIKNLITEALKNLGIEEVNFSVEHPEDLKNGDYSTNVAMVSAKKLKTNPKELAEKIVASLLPPDKGEAGRGFIENITVAGAGFINFYLSRKFFSSSVEEIVNKADTFGRNENLSGKKIMVEYTQPNPFKPFHIGHLMSNAIGESVSRVLQFSGAEVSRANYQGDVGLHVARAMYGLLKRSEFQSREGTHNEQSLRIGEAYVFGAHAYEEDEHAKSEIDELNKKIYHRSDQEVNELYDWGFEATMEAFEDLYALLGTKFDFYFLESVMAPIGEEIVRAKTGEIFEESNNAIVFKAETYDPKLHTRVFITSHGLPTYETKELGLTEEKFKTLPQMDLSITDTATEQDEYMKVVYKALSLIHPEYENKLKHISHGMMRFAEGKMSSRKGNIITGESLIRDTIALVKEKIKEETSGSMTEEEKNKISEAVGVAAIKYSILRSKAGSDIIYDVEESVSVEGDSGPYLQYSYARAHSILEKAQKENILPDFDTVPDEVFEVEKLLYRFPEVVLRASTEYEPHHIASYLIEVARAYNSFYGNNQIVSNEDKNSSYKVALTYAFSFVLKTGLSLLGIKAPEKM